MRVKQRYDYVIDYFSKAMPTAESELNYGNAFELLVAVVLSAQCTDKRVNLTTPALFAKYPTPEAMSKASAEEIYELIKSISYPNNKAKHLAQLSRQIVERFGGEVPTDPDDLQSLQGVGRKTANVIQAVAFGKAALAVDTHVFRVSHRLNLVPPTATTPYAVEKALRRYIPDETVAASHYWLLLHGRYTCTARNPKCGNCGLAHLCKWKGERGRG